MNAMIKRFALLFALTILVTAAACSTAESDKDGEAAAASPSASSPAASSPAAQKSPEELKNPVNALHISFNLPAGWTTENGEESFAFQRDGTPVGGLDGLGYNDTVEGLLPNGANVDSQEELTGSPVKAVLTKLSVEGQGEDGQREEFHILFFLPDQKAVYDLHFDAGKVTESEARTIAATAVTK